MGIGVGTGVLAYTLGMRHAFDADHISAIDNTTRKLVNEGKRPLSVGFFFSLGHSSVVRSRSWWTSASGAWMGADRLFRAAQQLHPAWGPAVSALFLFLIARSTS